MQTTGLWRSLFFVMLALAMCAWSADDATEKLDGTWDVLSHDTLGRPGSKKFLAQKHQWVFAKDILTAKDKSGVSRKGTFRIDPTKNPKTLDLTFEPGLPPGPKMKVPEGEMLNCIYALNGDALVICYGYSQDRPTAFESKANPGTGLVIFKRRPASQESRADPLPN